MADLFGRYPRRMTGMYSYSQPVADAGRRGSRSRSGQVGPSGREGKGLGKCTKGGRESAFTSRSGYSSRKGQGGRESAGKLSSKHLACVCVQFFLVVGVPRRYICILRRPSGPLSSVPDTIFLRLVCRTSACPPQTPLPSPSGPTVIRAASRRRP